MSSSVASKYNSSDEATQPGGELKDNAPTAGLSALRELVRVLARAAAVEAFSNSDTTHNPEGSLPVGRRAASLRRRLS